MGTYALTACQALYKSTGNRIPGQGGPGPGSFLNAGISSWVVVFLS